MRKHSNRRNDGWNPVIVVYRRSICWTDRVLQFAGAGEFTHCELYLPNEGTTFAIFLGGLMQCNAVLPQLYKSTPQYFAWHLLLLTDQEYERLKQWNVRQVTHHCRYNLSDLAWQITPSHVSRSCVHDLDQDAASDPRKMFCSQAVVLALREAFKGTGSNFCMQNFACSMNSRLTTPTELACSTAEHLGRCPHVGIIPTSHEDVNKHINEILTFSVSKGHDSYIKKQY